MLGKLFKYEFKNTAKVMLTIYAVFAVTTIIGSISFGTDSIQTNLDTQPLIIQLLLFATILLYILSVFALFVVTYVYVCIHFYKTMYSEQGYLTHTLPVKPMTLFNVKLITSWVWMMGSMLLFSLSLFGVLVGASRGEVLYEFDDVILQQDFLSLFGMTHGQFILAVVVSMAYSCLSYLLMVFVSISIGQLFDQHKIVWAIVAGIILYFINQTIGSIVLLATGGSIFDTFSYADNITVADILFSTPMVISMLISVLFVVAYYIACIIIQKKHLNLE